MGRNRFGVGRPFGGLGVPIRGERQQRRQQRN